jgi:translocation and assembly module TamB
VSLVGKLLAKLLRALLCLVAAVALLLGTAWALAHNEAATQQLLPMLPGVTVTGPQGALLGDFKAQRVDVSLPRGGRLSLIEPAWLGLQVLPDLHAPWHFGVDVASLTLRALQLNWVPDPVSKPALAPTDLGLPFALQVHRLQVAQAHSNLWGDQPLIGLDASLALQQWPQRAAAVAAPSGLASTPQSATQGASSGTTAGAHQAPSTPKHLLKLAHLTWHGWTLSGDAALAVSGPMQLDATLLARGGPAAAPLKAPGRAELKLHGPLRALSLQADATWQGAEATLQRVQVSGELAPFAPWPATALRAQAQALNLADVLSSLPRTALHGELELTPVGPRDVHAALSLRNELVGPWDAQRLPVRSLKGTFNLLGARAATSLSELLGDGRLDLTAQLPSGSAQADASVQVQGGWGGTRALRAQWRGLAPQALHSLAPPLQLQGSLDLRPEWPQLTSAPQAKPGALKTGESEQGAAQTPAPDQMRAMLTLESQGFYGVAPPSQADPKGARQRVGRAPAQTGGQASPPLARVRPTLAPVPVSLSLAGRYAPGQFSVSALSLRAHEAHADVQNAVLNWGGATAWQVKGHVQVSAFDPKVWLPWPELVTGRNAVSGAADLSLDANGHGQVEAKLAPSVLGGVPVQGQARWQSTAGSPLMSLSADVDAGGNGLQVQGDVPWRAGQAWDAKALAGAQWQGRIHAPNLQSLQPLAPLLGARQLAGLVDAQFKGQGAWPDLQTEGQLTVSQLQWVRADGAPLSLVAARAEWLLNTHAPDAPLHLQLSLAQGKYSTADLALAQWRLDGSAKAHQSHLLADASHTARAGAKPMAFHLEADANGGLLAQAAGWQGQVSQFLLRKEGSPPRDLLRAQPFSISWRDDAQGRVLQVGATAVNVLGASMRLQKLNWHQGGAHTAAVPGPGAGLIAAAGQGSIQSGLVEKSQAVGDTELQLQLEPFNLPALLASWQPQAGWSGDLMLGGQISLHHSARQPWVVDAEVARLSGDVSLAEPTIEGNVAQKLGVRAARVALQARNGVWTLSEQLDGRVSGVLTGQQVVHARTPDALPDAADALTGQLDLQVSSLRPWGAWIPAGWRLTGQLQAQAQLSGTLGVPQYRGQVKGQNLGLGQALEGINLTDGQLDMTLEGGHLHLTTLTAKSGTGGGTLRAQGQAAIGAQPSAELTLNADHFALLQRVDRRVVISGDVAAALGEQDVKVDGRIKVDEGLIDITRSDAPTIGDDVNVLNRPGQDAAEPLDTSAPSGPKRKVTLAVDVDLGRQLRLKGRGLDALLTGALRVSTRANKLAVQGTVRADSGTYAAYGQKLVIERGAIAFTGPIENPRLDILAMRKQSATATASDVKVGVSITGTAQDPRVSLYSDPSMSETEKLSWLVLGRAPTGLGGADIGLLQSAAVALLSGEGTTPTDNLVALLGLDELSVHQADTTVRETVVNVGKQVSRLWYVGYERNLAATSGNWQLIYRLGQRFTVRMQAGDDNAVDFIWAWRWN